MSVLAVVGIIAIVIVVIIIILVFWVRHEDEVYSLQVIGPAAATAAVAFASAHHAIMPTKDMLASYIAAGGDNISVPPAGPLISAATLAGQPLAMTTFWLYGKKPANIVTGVQPFSAKQWSQHTKK